MAPTASGSEQSRKQPQGIEHPHILPIPRALDEIKAHQAKSKSILEKRKKTIRLLDQPTELRTQTWRCVAAVCCESTNKPWALCRPDWTYAECYRDPDIQKICHCMWEESRLVTSLNKINTQRGSGVEAGETALRSFNNPICKMYYFPVSTKLLDHAQKVSSLRSPSDSVESTRNSQISKKTEICGLGGR
jgi:hypothetical protein